MTPLYVEIKVDEPFDSTLLKTRLIKLRSDPLYGSDMILF